MTPHDNHQLVRTFFTAIAAGDLPDDLLTDDMTAWTLSSGDFDKARFQGGIKLLAGIVSGCLRYEIDSLTAEDDRAVAEVRSDWTLINGETVQNHHVFLFRFRDGKVAALREYMDPAIPREKLGPLMQSVMERGSP